MADLVTITTTVSAAASAASAASSQIPSIEHWRAIMFDRLLIIVALAAVVAVIFHAGKIVLAETSYVELEVRKVRLAAATLTGILLLILFTSLLAYLDESSAGVGKEVFKTVLAALTPVAGVIIGYIFSTKR